MSEQPVGGSPAAAETVALQHAQQLQEMRAAVWATVEGVWSEVSPGMDWLTWWFDGARTDIYTALIMGQELAAMDASTYLRDVMAVQGYDIDVGNINAPAFASGYASDGRPLESLLDLVPFRALERQEQGATEAEALQSAMELLIRVTHTQVTDAGREADQVALVDADVAGVMSPEDIEQWVRERQRPFTNPLPTMEPSTRREREDRLKERKSRRPRPIGYIRLLTPPSCGRCAVLAGKWYGWNDGFERHDNCDCRHVPCLEADAGTQLTDPKEYFDSLSEADQNYYFGKANAQAIRDGADVSSVVNVNRKGALYTVGDVRYTREGATRRSYWRQTTGERGPRKTPVQIYREAKGDREAARRALRQFGYIGP